MWNLLKVNSRDCVSSLTTCNMYKTLFKCFSRVLWACLCLLWCFCFYDFFFDVFIVNLNRFHTLIYFFIVNSLLLVQKQPPEVFFKKSCSLKLRNIYRKTPVLGSLFNRGLQACNYIKRRLQHWCFLWNLLKLLRTPFLKNICERLLL